MEALSNIIVTIGLIFMVFGVIGMFRFKNFYLKILVASKVDTVGAFTIIIGLILRHGISYFSGKLVLILVLTLILNPLVAHTVASSAHASGYKLEGKQSEETL